MMTLKFTAGRASRRLALNTRQRSLVAGFLSNLAVVLVGLSLTNQPLATYDMTWGLRWSIVGVSGVLFSIGIWAERTGNGRAR